jgi:hypothetical protein
LPRSWPADTILNQPVATGSIILHQLAVPIILIPLIWLAVTMFVVAACQVAASADTRRP